MSTQADSQEKVTNRTLGLMKTQNEKIACMTAYDAAFAAVLERSGIEVILVGDSVGMVVQGQTTTIPVTIDEIIYQDIVASLYGFEPKYDEIKKISSSSVFITNDISAERVFQLICTKPPYAIQESPFIQENST